MNNLYVSLLHFIGFSHKKLFELFQSSSDFKNIFTGLNKEYLLKNGFSDKQSGTILKKRDSLDLEKYLQKISDHSVSLITYEDESYPELLKNIHNPPFIIYLQGKIDNGPKLSIVGSRKISSYGEKTIETLVPELGRYFSVVSGGAIGCDTHAHLSCLKHKVQTIAIVGTGIDLVYPTSNGKLYKEIVSKGGGVISSFPLGEKANRYNFPIRNEIVAGLSVGTIIIEAQKKSGSLITARLALDLGKDLFALPGEIFKLNSQGCNELILKGEAKIVTAAHDVLNEYNVAGELNNSPKKIHKFSGDKEEQKIYDMLLIESLSIDEILKKSDFTIQSLTLKLSLLEIGGYIQKTQSGKYELK